MLRKKNRPILGKVFARANLQNKWPAVFGASIGEHLTGHEETKALFRRRNHFEDFLKGERGSLPASSRLYLFYIVVFLLAAIFLGRLFVLTIVQGQKNRDLAENNRIRLIETEAARGKIFDRNNVSLADSKEVFVLRKNDQNSIITKDQVQELDRLGLASEDFEGTLGRISSKVTREYSFGEALAHVLGYLSEVSNEDLRDDPNLSLASKIGRGGIEASFDNFLTGTSGKKIIEVDASGKNISILDSLEPKSGRDLHLTIDSKLQQVVFEKVKTYAQRAGSRRGAAVVQNPNSGEVLALVSIPSFDPNDVGRFIDEKDKPFFNRVTQGTYPPGSIFKIVSALSALETGVISKDTQIEDVGEFFIGDDHFVNWYYLTSGGRDGILTVERAIARSNDIFFYRVAEKLGLEKLRQLAVRLGFGQKTGIELGDEALGLVPSDQWKKSVYGADWYLGDTLHLGIGQGFMLVTPIQINALTSFVASGKLSKPYLVSQIDGKDGQGTARIEGKVQSQDIVQGENLAIVREGMKQACEKNGTAWPFFSAKYTVGCKTGTAEKALGNPHAWFTAFAPFENPQISITVIIEDGGEGSSVAAPATREILDWWMANRQ